MAKIIFLIIIFFHGLIHLLGFVKAFGIVEIKEFTRPVSKGTGLLWLLTFLLLVVTSVQVLTGNQFWWIGAAFGIFLSQVLIIIFWQDAKSGTFPNVIILIAAIISFAEFNFNRSTIREIDELYSSQSSIKHDTITPERIAHLPKSLQKWIINSGLIGKERIYAVRLKQKARMKMKPEQKDWKDAHAEQYFTIDKPGFVWKVNMQMMPFVDISGMDKFIDGKGEMLIKIYSLIPVVNSGGNEKINTATIQRFLGEIVWFPSAALSPYIEWEQINDLSVRANMSYKGTTGSGIFYFDEKGNFERFIAQRYMETDDDAKLKEWIIKACDSRIMGGIKIPVKLEASWKLDTGLWTWLKLEITDINYNIPEKYLKMK